jgi:hypothetical protein
MKKYIISLVLTFISGVLLFLGAFDSEGFTLMLIFPIVMVLGLTSIYFKLSSGVLFRQGYWDIFSFIIWFALMTGYSNFAYSRLSSGDVIWYSNIMLANQIITATLLVSLIFIFTTTYLKRNKS